MNVYVVYFVEESHVGVEYKMNKAVFSSEVDAKAEVSRLNDAFSYDGYADYDILEMK